MIVKRARQLRAQIEGLAETLDDTTALANTELFPEWKTDTAYAADKRVRYEGILYRCLIAHTSQDAWTPTDAPSLWARVLIPDPDVLPEWVQPDSTNPYMAGDRVMHNDKKWESIIDYNIWEPGVYGWDEI